MTVRDNLIVWSPLLVFVVIMIICEVIAHIGENNQNKP